MVQTLNRRPAAHPAESAAKSAQNVMTCDIPMVRSRRTHVPTAPTEICRPTGRSRRERRGSVRTAPNSAVRATASALPSLRAGDSNTRVRSNSPAAVSARSGRARIEREQPLPAVYQRRRRAAAGLLTGIALAVLVWVLAIVGNTVEDAAGMPPSSTEVVHVRSGESLTSLAERIAPDLPADGVIAVVRELNDLSTSGLLPGQPLVVPVYR